MNSTNAMASLGRFVLSAAVLALASVLPASQALAGSSSAPSGAGALVGGAGVSDALFQQPYVDIDEWRDAPVRHRYVHGGFKGTDARFSFYFPETTNYQGRFFQYVTPVPDSETLSQGQTGEDDKIGFALSHGAYFIETNGGGAGANAGPAFAADPTIGGYRANAAVAQYSRQLAVQMYGPKRPYGYIFGGSGGVGALTDR